MHFSEGQQALIRISKGSVPPQMWKSVPETGDHSRNVSIFSVLGRSPGPQKSFSRILIQKQPRLIFHDYLGLGPQLMPVMESTVMEFQSIVMHSILPQGTLGINPINFSQCVISLIHSFASWLIYSFITYLRIYNTQRTRKARSELIQASGPWKDYGVDRLGTSERPRMGGTKLRGSSWLKASLGGS